MKLTQQTNLVIAGRDGADSRRLLQAKGADAFAERSGQAIRDFSYHEVLRITMSYHEIP